MLGRNSCMCYHATSYRSEKVNNYETRNWKIFPPISKMDTETTDPPNSSNEVLKWAWRSCGWFEHSESWKKSPMGPDLSVEKVISWPKVRIPPWFRLIFHQKQTDLMEKPWTKLIWRGTKSMLQIFWNIQTLRISKILPFQLTFKQPKTPRQNSAMV